MLERLVVRADAAIVPRLDPDSADGMPTSRFPGSSSALPGNRSLSFHNGSPGSGRVSRFKQSVGIPAHRDQRFRTNVTDFPGFPESAVTMPESAVTLPESAVTFTGICKIGACRPVVSIRREAEIDPMRASDLEKSTSILRALTATFRRHDELHYAPIR